MKNPIPGRGAWGSHLRVLLLPQALWRLTRPAGLQRLNLPSVKENDGPSHIWVPPFLPPHLSVCIRLERVRNCAKKQDDCVHQEASEKNNWKRQSAIPTAIQATMLCKTSATQKGNDPQQALHIEQSGRPTGENVTLRDEASHTNRGCDVSAFVPGIARMDENVMDRDMKIEIYRPQHEHVAMNQGQNVTRFWNNKEPALFRREE